MKKKKTIILFTALLLVFALFLGACTKNEESTADPAPVDTNTENPSEAPADVEADDPTAPQEGGTLIFALDSEFKGLLDVNFYDSAVDGDILNFTTDGLLKYDENLQIQPHIATWETEDNQHYSFTFQQGVKWHDGEELTVHDWVFALETIAKIGGSHQRYVNVSPIVGVKEFSEGTADSISGIEIIDDYNINITLDMPRVNNLENLWTNPMSRTAFAGINPGDMEASAAVRTNPVGLGPFKITRVIPGESVELERHEEYWQGKPHIEKIIVKVINPSLTVGELENGTIDITPFHPTILSDIQSLENVKFVEQPGLTYYYIGFKLGHWDGEKNVMDNPKYQNKDLRKAMYYALNREEWVDAFFSGLGTPVNRPMPTNHWIAASDDELPNNYTYDPEKAKELLDQAGYVDVNGDGFREDPEGNEFVIKFGHYATSNPTFEARATAITQYWNDVGLKTELVMPDSNLYYDMLDNDDPSIEVFYAGWGTGSDPDPIPLWATEAFWNHPRWVNEKNDQLMKDAVDINVVGTDTELRKSLYVEWQANFNEELPGLPIMELNDPYALTERVQGVTFSVSGLNSAHEWWLKQ